MQLGSSPGRMKPHDTTGSPSRDRQRPRSAERRVAEARQRQVSLDTRYALLGKTVYDGPKWEAGNVARTGSPYQDDRQILQYGNK
jgi:hypothetical protein